MVLVETLRMNVDVAYEFEYSTYLICLLLKFGIACFKNCSLLSIVWIVVRDECFSDVLEKSLERNN